MPPCSNLHKWKSVCVCPQGCTEHHLTRTTQSLGMQSNRGKCLHLLVGVVEYCASQNVTPYQNYRPEFKLQFLPKTEQEEI